MLKEHACDVFFLNGGTIPINYSYKYLGHFINEDMKDDTDIERQCQKLYAQ